MEKVLKLIVLNQKLINVQYLLYLSLAKLHIDK